MRHIIAVLLVCACILVCACGAGGKPELAPQLVSPRSGEVLHPTGRNQGFFDLAFESSEEVPQGCAIIMLLNGARVAHWIPDPLLPAGSAGAPGLWGLNEKWDTFSRGLRKSVSVALPLGQHRAWAVAVCPAGGGVPLVWETWKEGDCEGPKCSCERGPEVPFSVVPPPGGWRTAVPRVELVFPGSLAVIKQGDPLTLRISLHGLGMEEQLDSRCAVLLNLASVVEQRLPPAGGNSFATPQHKDEASLSIPCNDCARPGHPGSAARLAGKAQCPGVHVPPGIVEEFLRAHDKAAGAKGVGEGTVLIDVSLISAEAAGAGEGGRQGAEANEERGDLKIDDSAFQRTTLIVHALADEEFRAWWGHRLLQVRAPPPYSLLPTPYTLHPTS